VITSPTCYICYIHSYQYHEELQQDWVKEDKIVTLHVKQTRKCLFLKFPLRELLAQPSWCSSAAASLTRDYPCV